MMLPLDEKLEDLQSYNNASLGDLEFLIIRIHPLWSLYARLKLSDNISSSC